MKKFTVFVLVFVWGLLWNGSCVKADTISEDIVMPNETCTIGKGYIDIGESIKAQGDKGLLGQSKPPSSYDSRTKNQVTSVKNQGGYGTCWAFAALGAGESSMLAKGRTRSMPDYSEAQLAYFFYHHADDPLGNLSGDSTTLTGSNYLMIGGNHYFTMMALATWLGAVDEKTAPYNELDIDYTLPENYAYQKDVAHLKNAHIVSMKDSDRVKELILEYGAVACSFYIDDRYYSYGENAYYFTDSNGYSTNHAIDIIGWDDDYAISNFSSTSGCVPQNPGAWLIKNSYGEGNKDYIWVSYEDLALSNSDAFAFEFEDAQQYDYNYQYDGSYGASYVNLPSGDSLANVYTISGAVKERIDAVSIALRSGRVDYRVQLYLNPSEDTPLSGTPLLNTPLTGTTTDAGYYTIELPSGIEVKNGDKIAVVFTLSSEDGSKVQVFGDVSYVNKSGDGTVQLSFKNTISRKQSYHIYQNYQNYANDMYTSGLNPRIKLFTKITDGNKIETEDTQCMYRLYNPNSGEHFYTADQSEKEYLSRIGWNDEGVAWYAPKTGASVYRLYNPNAGDHHYTTSLAEKENLVRLGWNYEGIAWYSGGIVPLYRAYNPNAVAGSHHYTTNRGEINYLISVGWKDEKIAWYGVR